MHEGQDPLAGMALQMVPVQEDCSRVSCLPDNVGPSQIHTVLAYLSVCQAAKCQSMAPAASRQDTVACIL